MPQQVVHETKEDFIFAGLMNCATSGRKATCDLKKGKYVYLIVRDPADPNRKVWVKEADVLAQLRPVLRSIQIPEAVLAEMLDHLRQSHEAEKVFHKNRIKDLQREDGQLQRRLDELTDLLLDRSITRDMYDRRHQQIRQRQHEIAELLKDSHEADGQFKIALSGLLALASKVPDLFESSKNAEKRLLLGFLFSNLALKGVTLRYTLREPFDRFVDLAGSQDWLAFLDTVRTERYDQTAALKASVIRLPAAA